MLLQNHFAKLSYGIYSQLIRKILFGLYILVNTSPHFVGHSVLQMSQ